MKVTTIKAAIRYSRQLPDGSWKTVELGAEATVDGPPSASQMELYQTLKAQMHTLWNNSTPEPTTPELPVPQPTAEQPICPDHHDARESTKHAGLYCPTRNEDGTFCRWSYPPRQTKKGAK